MVNVKDRTCQSEGCRKIPCYNNPGEKEALYCASHRTEEMVNVKNKTCRSEGCRKIPNYNKPGETKALYCVGHRTGEMVDVKHQTCRSEGCRKIPNYNKPGETKALYCVGHRTGEMVDVKHQTCRSEGCQKRPHYNKPGEKEAFYCAGHKTGEMVDVKLPLKTCFHPQCDHIPLFNLKGKKPLYCQEHAQPGMVNLQESNHCLVCEAVPLCKFQDHYYCSAHYPDRQAIARLDPSSRQETCSQCLQKPLCSVNGSLYCSEHYPDHSAIQQFNRRFLKKVCSKCEREPLCQLNGSLYCADHYPDRAAITRLNRECKYCDLAETAYVCQECQTRRHRKEWTVVAQLRKEINQKAVHDSNHPVSECSKRRPDLFYECHTHAVIVEIDENQHRDYQPSCECARISEIAASLGGQPITIIRYNPDSIRHDNKSVKVEAKTRIELLVKTLKRELNSPPTKYQIKLIQLFFDDNGSQEYQPVKEEDITDLVAV
jgi:hypothetical protein